MIAAGREPMRTCPLAAATVVGKLPAAAGDALAVLLGAWELPHAAHAAARAAAAAKAGRRRERTHMIILRRVVEDEVRPLRHRRGIETNRPSSEDSTSAPARRPGSFPAGASPLRDSAGISPASLGQRHPGWTQDNRYLIAAGRGRAVLAGETPGGLATAAVLWPHATGPALTCHI